MSTPTILLVDGTPRRRNALYTHLRQLGYASSADGTVLAALNRLAERDFDIVLISEDLVDAAGFRTLSRASGLAQDPTSILLMDDPGRRKRYAGRGLDHFAQRPVTMTETAELIAIAWAQRNPGGLQRAS